MTDENDKHIERLKAALAADLAPEPRAEARRAAIDAALGRFDEKFAEARQGSAAEERPKGRRSSLNLFGRRSMKTSFRKLRPALLGGASLAVLALGVVITQQSAFGPLPMFDKAFRESGPDAGGGGLLSMSSGEETDVDNDAPAMRDLLDLSRLARDNQEPAPAVVEELARADQDRARSEPEFMRKLHERGLVANPRAQLGERGQAELKSRGLVAPAGRIAAGGLAQPADGVAANRRLGGDALEADERVSSGYQDQGRDRFEESVPNPVKLVAEEPVSTFSIDVDTASYSASCARR